jgi:hypothetical protein
MVVSQEHFDGHSLDKTLLRGSRRATMDVNGSLPSHSNVGSPRPIQHAATDETLDREKRGKANANDYTTVQGNVRTHISLHAMVKRAMAMVNLKPEEEEENKLSVFGTRRVSLF